MYSIEYCNCFKSSKFHFWSFPWFQERNPRALYLVNLKRNWKKSRLSSILIKATLCLDYFLLGGKSLEKLSTNFGRKNFETSWHPSFLSKSFPKTPTERKIQTKHKKINKDKQKSSLTFFVHRLLFAESSFKFFVRIFDNF